MLLGQTQAPCPFPIDSPPTWEEFLRVIQGMICSNINKELGDAQEQIELLVEQTRAQRDLLLQADGHMASQMQAMEERMRGYFSAVQSESRELLEQAVSSLKEPLLAFPRWDRALQEGVRNQQYTLRPASRVRGRSKARNRLAGSGQIPSTRDRAEQASRARRRTTIVPATSSLPVNVTSEQVPGTGTARALATEARSRVVSNASFHGGDDSEEEDFLESQTGSPELDRSWSETPFANLFNESRNFMDEAHRNRISADARNRDSMPFGLPAQNQGTAADEITQSLDVENRPQMTIPPQEGSRRVGAKEKDLRNLAQRFGPDRCTQCHRAGNSAISCPRCLKCQTYCHDESSCTWCYQCQSYRCKEICVKCRGAHTHNLSCLLAQRAMAILSREHGVPWTSLSPRMQRILRQMYEVMEEVLADVDAYREVENGTRDKGKGRADPGPTGGKCSGAAGGGGKPPSPPPENNARRQSCSWSPRDNRGGGGS